MFVDSSNGFGEVSEHLLIFQIELPLIVVDNPGEDWILREIVMRPACKDIENVEVMNIRYISVGPAMSDFR